MLINLISNDNGAGLSKDMTIIESLLTEHTVHRIQFDTKPPPADVNIFLEILTNAHFLNTAKVNILIPNLEWFSPKWLKTAQRMDAVFCKTRDAETFFLRNGCKTVYTGFTSVDMGTQTDILKKNRGFIHVAGKSISKGTAEVLKAWKMLPEGVNLFVVGGREFRSTDKMTWIKELSDDAIRVFMNQNTFHLCPSLAEGWGHYIHEAKSCRAVILTTDAEPMNTFIERRDGFFCKTQLSRPHHCGVFHHPKPESIAEKVQEMAAMTDQQIDEMGARARADFLLRDKIFRSTFMQHFNKLINDKGI